MRRSYEINSKKCHFYEGDNEISHDVSDLFDLLSIPVEAQGAVLYQWKGRITTYVDEGGEGKVIYLIPELDLNNEWKRCRFEAAEQRKAARLQDNHHPSCSIYKNT